MTQDALSWTPSHTIVIKPKRNFYHLPHIKTVSSDMLETVFVMPYQNRFPAFRKKNHLILRRITIGAYAMLPFRRATAYNSLIA